MNIPFVDLQAQYQSIKREIDTAIFNVINETAFIGGKYVKEFEAKFAEIYGVKHVVSCANGTDSLYIIMKMLGIGLGDQVITVANSWISSSETISQTGAEPIFVDIDPVYFSMDENLLEAAITQSTKALVLVHLHGQMCNMEKITEVCKRRNIIIIEDCAQSHFSTFKGVRAGLTGIAGSFSFYPGKNLGAYGDAGCIITNDDALAEKCRMYASHGALKKHEHKIEGINSRLDGLQASILSAKLPHILKWTAKRQQVATWYSNHLSGIREVTIPEIRNNTEHSFHLYVIRAERREELIKFLKEKGVETAIHYPIPLPLMEAYQYLGYTREDFPESVKAQTVILSLPLYPEMTEDMVIYVSEIIKDFYKKNH
jgi:dTDP-4-amino-4,6-dideoxygalactose transaminase